MNAIAWCLYKPALRQHWKLEVQEGRGCAVLAGLQGLPRETGASQLSLEDRMEGCLNITSL